jgi:hypothetical protein
VLPSFILIKLSGVEYLGTIRSLILALSFPVIYGVFGLVKNKKVNVFSIIGLISIVLTGAFSLLSLDAKWITLKEAGIPFILGVFVLFSLKTPFPIIKKLLLNVQILNMVNINSQLVKVGKTSVFEKRITISTFMLSGSFFLSSFLNSLLAKNMLKSAPGTTAFNEELGLMTAYSFPIIAIPSLIIIILIFFYITRSIMSLTGMKFSEILSEGLDK